MDEDLKSLLNGLGGFYLVVSYYQEIVQVSKQLDSEESQAHYKRSHSLQEDSVGR